MRTPLRSIAVAWLLAMAIPAFAATPTEFYLNLLRRGTVDVETGQYQRALNSLRIAAFGLVDSIEHYQTAQVYLAVAADRLAVEQAIGEAVRRVVLAQRIEPRYALLRLPAEIRSSFESIARKTLGPGDSATLFANPPAVPTQTPTTNPPSSPPVSAAVVTPAPVSVEAETAKPAQPPVAAPAKLPEAAPAGPEPSQIASKPVVKPAEVKPADTQVVEATVYFEPAPAAPPSTSTEPEKASASTPAKWEPKKAPEAKAPPADPEPAPAPAPAAGAKPEPPRSGTPAKTAATAPGEAVGAPRPTRAREAQQPIRVDPVPILDPAALQVRLADASKALAEGRLIDARVIYRDLLADPALRRDTVIRAGEGLYRARDFAGAFEAFQRIGELRKGEEPYRYYVAVALYETGQYARAKEELTAALPFIELTPDVVRYRAKIEGSLR